MNSLNGIILSRGEASIKGKALAEGQKIFVRVLGEAQNAAASGKARYEVAFGGARFFAESFRALNAGDSFPALIKYQDGKIMLVPQDDAARDFAGMKFFPNGASDMPPALASFLSALGIPADFVSLSLVRFMQQFGFKFDTDIAQKARKLARRFPGRESDAAEAAIHLLEKGIEPDDDMIAQIINLYDAPNQHGARNHGSDDSAGSEEDKEIESNAVFWLFDAESLLEAQPGTLTLCNHLAVSNRHWITLPFEKGENLHGVVRFLLNINEKIIEKAEIRTRVIEKPLCFVIYYSHGTPSEILFYGDGIDAEQLSNTLTAQDIHLNVRRAEQHPALFTEDKELFIFHAEA